MMMNPGKLAWRLLARRFTKLNGLDIHQKDVIRRTGQSIFMRLLRTGISFVFNVLLMRLLGAEGAGVYALAYTITRVASIVGRVGMDQAVVRFTAANAALNDWRRVRGVYQHALLLCLILSALAMTAVFASAPLIGRIFSDSTLVEPLRWMSLSIIPWSFLWLQSFFLQGIERIEDSIFVQSMGVPIVNIPILLLMTGAFGVVGAAMSYAVACALIALLGLRLWKRYTPQLREVEGAFERRELLQTSMPLFWMDLTMVLIGVSDTLLLGYFTTSQAVGVYDAAKRISVLTSAFLVAAAYVATPKFAALHAKGEFDKLASLARNTARLTTLMALPALVVFTLFPEAIMGIYGAEFREGGIILFILAIGQFINAATGATGYLLIMTGHEKTMRNITLGASAFKLALYFLLIPSMGYVGAALATMIGDSARELLAVYYIYRKLSMLTLPIPGAWARAGKRQMARVRVALAATLR
jgi:O-antigen/teichoic acid export membrane protein